LFYLCETSIATKTPLPSELPSLSTARRGIHHDALVISSRLWKSEAGRKIVRSEAFLRYWFFLSTYGSVGDTLETMEEDLRVLFDVDEGV
jgi:hypothetical protein